MLMDGSHCGSGPPAGGRMRSTTCSQVCTSFQITIFIFVSVERQAARILLHKGQCFATAYVTAAPTRRCGITAIVGPGRSCRDFRLRPSPILHLHALQVQHASSSARHCQAMGLPDCIVLRAAPKQRGEVPA